MIYDDLRVLDLSSGLACAYAAKLLTDLGAEVVHWEPRVAIRCVARIRTARCYAYLRTSQRRRPATRCRGSRVPMSCCSPIRRRSASIPG